ncbi:tyrosine-type recombinase/integrase [Actinophytocola sp.]|uniref:tyrosine-type recombinase/integrase n=1 Tax=Actinophytocola sp. TaxID=1872138 RepID=UPI002D5A7CCD|nr:tyrosine-type recombinase/integrase [Actinophytocola sp.]HYQ66150.1 tyrosine-type recombinase/integrase [Actinophytocola sp.]
MSTTFDVKFWKIEKRERATKTNYRVAWLVNGRKFTELFVTEPLADSFRSDLVAAARRGEAFDCDQGLPVSMIRAENAMSWFAFAVKYIDMKWPRAAAKSRAGNADALATITPMMFSTDRGNPDARILRRALTGWAFNTKNRDAVQPLEIERALKWMASNTLPVARLEDVAMLRQALDMLSKKLDGKQAAAKTVTRKRAVLYNALDYAVELKALSANNLHEVKWTAPKTVRAIDKRVVINKSQAKRLLNGVAAQWVEDQPRRSSGPRLKAFFAVMYYAALRPEEAAMLSKPDLQLPEQGWGELLLSRTAPTAGASWTDSGERRDRRQLKQRAEKEVRLVPSPPQLTQILHEHLKEFGTAADGRLFRNLTGGDLAESTIARVWGKARRIALTEEEYASALARRPYDLRHACVSTWLAAGVPSTQCAEWAGHSVGVLHQIYAKVIAGLEDAAHERIEKALSDDEDE